MTTAADIAPALKCRYRYATGCTAEFGSKPGLGGHERTAHQAHHVELRVCPVCGDDCGSEMERGRHLSNEHDARAGSERRQDLDARQVLELLGPRTDAGTPAGVPMPGFTRENHGVIAAPPAAGPDQVKPEPPMGEADAEPAAADPLSTARDAFDAIADEVEELRAENARLRTVNARLAAESATFATVRTLLAGQNGTREHAAAP
jgi:hypothetical protein